MKKIKIYVMLSVIIIIIVFSAPLFKYRDANQYVCKDCNVLLVVIDTLRADHLGTYGYHRNTSPNIDRFAEDSIVFENAYAQSSYTLSSHMSLFTSLYPNFHNIILATENNTLDRDIQTLPEILQKNNYSTFWYAPLSDMHLNLERGFRRGFDGLYSSQTEDYIYWNNAVKRIKEMNNDKFFMFLHTYLVHDPYNPGEKSLSKFTNETYEHILYSENELIDEALNRIVADPKIIFKEDIIENNQNLFDDPDALRAELEHDGIFSELLTDPSNTHITFGQIMDNIFWENINLSDNGQMEFVKTLYDAEIYDADQLVKKITDVLEEKNLEENTIVIITSDHGEEFMEHGGNDHARTLYEEVIHVPLIIKFPGMGSQRISQTAELVDVMPSILESLGIPPPDYINGKSLLAAVLDDKQSVKEFQISELTYQLKSIRKDEWKYIGFIIKLPDGSCLLSDERSKLYNLKIDKEEKNNLILEEPDIADELRSELSSVFSKRLPFDNPVSCNSLTKT